jgi:chromate transporter
MGIHIGYVRAGWRGLIVAGICFIIPAVLITLLLAYLYTAYGSMPQLHPFIQGIRPAIHAVIFAAVIPLSKPMMKKYFMVILGFFVLILNLIGVNAILLLLSSGVLGIMWKYRHHMQESIVS